MMWKIDINVYNEIKMTLQYISMFRHTKNNKRDSSAVNNAIVIKVETMVIDLDACCLKILFNLIK